MLDDLEAAVAFRVLSRWVESLNVRFDEPLSIIEVSAKMPPEDLLLLLKAFTHASS